MLKKGIVFISISLCIFLVGFIVKEALYQPQLKTNIKIEESEGDFNVHITVEKTQDGFQILRSLEYRGDEGIQISHRTPLIEVMINKNNPEFTGSPVNRQLIPGSHYHPQGPLKFDDIGEGIHDIYVHAQFETADEKIDIQTTGQIEIN